MRLGARLRKSCVSTSRRTSALLLHAEIDRDACALAPALEARWATRGRFLFRRRPDLGGSRRMGFPGRGRRARIAALRAGRSARSRRGRDACVRRVSRLRRRRRFRRSHVERRARKSAEPARPLLAARVDQLDADVAASLAVRALLAGHAEPDRARIPLLRRRPGLRLGIRGERCEERREG